MKTLQLLLFASLISFWSCSKDDIDEEKPTIDISFSEAFPTNCATIQRGGYLFFKVKFSDNQALGSYSVDIHHNFDHHSHSTEGENCTLDPIKAAVQPLLIINNYPIPEGSTQFTATESIAIPSSVDIGDYHFMYKLTDASGWQTIKSFSIKITD